MHTACAWDSISDHIRGRGWAHCKGDALASFFAFDSQYREDFFNHWENLSLDENLPDGGSYRYRRFSEFSYQVGGGVHKLPHFPPAVFQQEGSLNGGLARQFSPLEDSMVNHPFFLKLLTGMAKVFDGVVGFPCNWRVRVHPYRVATNEFEQGNPTPEGRHRDGVHYLVMVLIARVGITGGMTRISNPLNETLCEITMLDELEVIFGDDTHVMHEVSPIICVEPTADGYRDTLVIDFTRNDKL